MIFIISTGILGLVTITLSIVLYKTIQAQKFNEEGIDKEIERAEKILNNIVIRMKSRK